MGLACQSGWLFWPREQPRWRLVVVVLLLLLLQDPEGRHAAGAGSFEFAA